MAAGRSFGRLKPDTACLFVCDIQERFRSVIKGMPAVIDSSQRLVKAFQALEIPILVSEQYPKALGSTVDEIKSLLPDKNCIFEKTKFSMCIQELEAQLQKQPDRKQVVLVGIEAHVCVTQTALELLEGGYEVHVVTDAVSSSRLGDRATAIQRMMQSGAFAVTSEMVMFQLCGGAKHPAFKTISTLAKEQRPDMLPAASDASKL
ncbi:hypothetical protein WJX74_009140 [Apatococcus lobatus]|uniref:Isochorismatase-like domain-containing protein n=2 Tax=Apatococcus TaxID=904362 RepID=A0AAW1SRV8_9CHLO